MCGIFCAIFNASKCQYMCLDDVYRACVGNIKNRGPDCQKRVDIRIDDWHLLASGSVLWLQGPEPVVQPVESERSLFLYNGDIFDSELLPQETRNENGDTQPLLKIIESSTDLVKSLQKLHGPYAFIYVDKINKKVFFCRDIFGRRSLLIGKNDGIVLTSVAARTTSVPMMELPALGIFCFDLTTETITLLPWRHGNQHFETKLHELITFLGIDIKSKINQSAPTELTFPERNEIEMLETLQSYTPSETFKFLLSNDGWKRNIDRLTTLLETAVKQRVENQPLFCADCIKERLHCEHCLIGVLFSGGLDCAIISLITDKFIDKSRQIDLLNVAFERSGSYDTPDRLTARGTLEELKRLRPDRRWNLVEINVTQEELFKERSECIGDLIFPLRTILDESLGCALWFASRGKTMEYTSSCRVLFVGMGADELFGGYTRHRAAYKRGHWKELTIELDNDWKNISHRNLARDDRIVSDHGRQLRTPYLDENVVEFVRNLHAWEKCFPSETVPQGVGDKLLLRSIAFQLGLEQAAMLRKRALQFGSRIANSKENAHDVSPRL